MFMKKPQHRIFDYQPRFYDPLTDEKEKKKRRLGFTRQRKFNSKKKSPIIWIVLILLVVFIYLKLSGG